MQKQYIDALINKMRSASEEDESIQSRNQITETKEAIGKVVAKQVLRKMVEEGYKSPERAKSRKTAQRIDLDKLDEKKIPSCPPGYVFDRKRMDCIPIKQRDKVSGNHKDTDRDEFSGAAYNVWGKTGLNGDGYAYEEPAGMDANSSHWDTNAHSIGEAKKKCKDGYEWDSELERCVRTSGGNRTIIIGRGWGHGHHDNHEDENNGDPNEGSDGGGDAGGGMGESLSVWGPSLKFCFECENPKEKCSCKTPKTPCKDCGYTRCRCNKPLARPFGM